MKKDPQEPAALEKRAQPGRLRAMVLAVVVHLAFFALIIFGVSWQSSPTPPMQAELWDKLPPVAARSSTPKPEPEPPKPEPPKPAPSKPEPLKPDPPRPDPAIAQRLEREKRETEKRERVEKQKQDDAKRKREQEDVAKKKREQDDVAKKKREQEDVAKKKLEDDKRRVEEERARAEATNARQKAIDGFVDKIKARIRGRANVPDTVSGKPSVQVRIRILPGGEVLDIAVTRSSGNRVYDTAIERAIRSASPLPVPEASSELFPQFRDLILNIDHER